MKANARMFNLIAAFVFLMAVIYWFLSEDPSGATPLAFAGGLMFLIGYYLDFTDRRLPPQPEDVADAEIADGAGEMGFFSPFSWWPIAVAASVSLLVLGLIFGMWLVLGAAIMVLMTVTGLLFEYYVGHQPHRREAGSN